MEKSIVRVLEAIETIRKGGMVIMVDDEDRENEGDIVFAAEHVTPEKINFMAKEARGLICLPLAPDIVDNLKLPLMDDQTKGSGGHTTAFTVSIEARLGVTTGISAADRARTIQAAVADHAKPEDLVVPGHIFPLRAKRGGVLERSGHTEGSVDLAKLAGFKQAAVICEIMNDDGSMARMVDLIRFSEKHKLPIVTIEDLIAYRLTRDSLVRQIGEGEVQTDHGPFTAVFYESVLDHTQHVALVKGRENFPHAVVDVRVHRQKSFLDVFGRSSNSSVDLLNYGFEMLQKSEAAVLIYLLNSNGDQIWAEYQKTYVDKRDRVEAKFDHMDSRLLGIGAQILRDLGVQRMKTHVTQTRTLVGLAGFGLELTDSVLIK